MGSPERERRAATAEWLSLGTAAPRGASRRRRSGLFVPGTEPPAEPVALVVLAGPVAGGDANGTSPQASPHGG